MKRIKIIDNRDGTASFKSVGYKLGDIQDISLHVTFTAGLDGTLSLEASNIENPATDADWVQVDGSQQSVTAGAAHMWNVINATYDWVRISWTFGANAGSLNAYLIIKENVTKGN